jgi:hypothetical protein
MLLVMIGITGFSFAEGDVNAIAKKYDMDGIDCDDKYPNKLFTRLMPKRQYKNSLGMTSFETGAQKAYLHYSVCVEECPKNGTEDIKYLPTKEYEADDARLSSWDHDTQKVMGFCFPDT